MIPVTYPSSVSTSKESQMVVFALTSVTGLKRWTDYIPVKIQSVGTANSFNTDGYIACDFLTSTVSKQAWIDYIPVFVDDSATTPWQVSDTGYIPFNTLPGGGIYFGGASLDLNFVGLDAETADTLDLDFIDRLYGIFTPYAVQADFAINYGLLPTALAEAAVNTEPAKTLFKDTLIGGRPLGDINNDGSVTSADATAYTRFNGPFWLNTADRNEYIRTVLNPYMLANPTTYAAYLLPA